MNDDRVRRAYEEYVTRARPAGRAACPPPEALMALAERTGSEADRLTTLDHAMACDFCRRDLDLLRTVAAAGRASAPRRWASPPLLAAAALVMIAVGVGVFLSTRPDVVEPAFRAGGAVVTLVAPVDSVNAGVMPSLVWRAVPGAVVYRVELLGAAGDSVYAATTRDTAVMLSGAAVVAGGEYLWSVRAEYPDGTQAVSEAARFRVVQR